MPPTPVHAAVLGVGASGPCGAVLGGTGPTPCEHASQSRGASSASSARRWADRDKRRACRQPAGPGPTDRATASLLPTTTISRPSISPHSSPTHITHNVRRTPNPRPVNAGHDDAPSGSCRPHHLRPPLRPAPLPAPIPPNQRVRDDSPLIRQPSRRRRPLALSVISGIHRRMACQRGRRLRLRGDGVRRAPRPGCRRASLRDQVLHADGRGADVRACYAGGGARFAELHPHHGRSGALPHPGAWEPRGQRRGNEERRRSAHRARLSPDGAAGPAGRHDREQDRRARCRGRRRARARRDPGRCGRLWDWDRRHCGS